MARTGEGGGYGARVVTHTQCPKQEPISHAISIGAVSRIGAKVGPGTPKKELYSGKGFTPPAPPSNGRGQGPGSNHQVYRAGSQSKTPAPRPMGPGRSLFK